MDFIKAVEKGKIKKIKKMISEGADVNMRDSIDSTALLRAIISNNFDVVKILVENGADVNLEGCGSSPLYRAARDADIEVLEYLLENGGRIDLVSPYGPSSLSIAMTEEYKNKVVLLLKHGATNRSFYPIIKRHEISIDFLKILIDDEIIDLNQDDLGIRLIIQAMKSGKEIDEERIKLLMSYDLDFKTIDGQGKTLLHHMIFKAGYDEYIENLLEEDINLNAQDDNKYTALMYAAGNNYINGCKILLKHNADMSLQEGLGRTALHEAVEGGHGDVVRLLLDHGANIEAGDDSNRTPLFFAAKKGYFQVVKLLVERGADINALSCNGKTIIQEAIDNNHQDIADFLIKKKF